MSAAWCNPYHLLFGANLQHWRIVHLQNRLVGKKLYLLSVALATVCMPSKSRCSDVIRDSAQPGSPFGAASAGDAAHKAKSKPAAMFE